MEKLTIGIDIGGTNFRIGAVTPGGQVLHFEKMSSRIFDRGDVVQTLCGQINAYTERYGCLLYTSDAADEILGV